MVVRRTEGGFLPPFAKIEAENFFQRVEIVFSMLKVALNYLSVPS